MEIASLGAASEEIAASGSGETRLDERRIFIQLMADPGNVPLNLKYAWAKYEKGELDRALETFRRVLSIDPANEKARAGIQAIEEARRRAAAKKGKTTYRLSLGYQYESNAKNIAPPLTGFDDTTKKIAFNALDRRTVGGKELETSFTLFKSRHKRWRAGDLLFVGLNSGPNLKLGDATLRVAPAFKYARLSTLDLFYSYGVTARYREDTDEAFRGIDVNASIDSYRGNFRSYSGPRFSAKLKYLLRGLYSDTDTLSLDPMYKHVHGYGGDGANRYDALGISIKYRKPLSSDLLFTGALTSEVRYYGGKDQGETAFTHRRDLKLKPEVRFTFANILPYEGNLDTNVNYEANISNDQDKKFRGYQIGATAKWKF